MLNFSDMYTGITSDKVNKNVDGFCIMCHYFFSKLGSCYYFIVYDGSMSCAKRVN